MLLMALLMAASAPAAESAAQLSVAVWPLEAKGGITADTAELLGERLANAVMEHKAFSRVVTNKELEASLSLEARKQMLNCGTDSCTAELAGALNVTHVITGNVGMLGAARVLNLRLIDIRKVVVVGSIARKVAGDDEALFDAIQPSVEELLGKTSMKAAASPSNASQATPSSSSSEPNSASASLKIDTQDTPIVRYVLWGVGGAGAALTGGLLVPLLGLLVTTGAFTASFWGGDPVSTALRGPTTFPVRAGLAAGAGVGAGVVMLVALVGGAAAVALIAAGVVAG